MEKTFKNTSKQDFNLIVSVGTSQVEFFLPQNATFKVNVEDGSRVEFKAAKFDAKSEPQFELQEI